MEKQAAPRKLVLLIIWGALTASVGVYVLLAYQIQPRGGRPAPPGDAPLYLAELLSWALPVLMLGAGLTAYRVLRPSLDDPFPGTGEPVSTQPVWQRISTATIVMMALFEVTVVAGLLFFFLGAPMGVFLRYAGATVLLDVIGLTRFLPDATRVEEMDREGPGRP